MELSDRGSGDEEQQYTAKASRRKLTRRQLDDDEEDGADFNEASHNNDQVGQEIPRQDDLDDEDDFNEDLLKRDEKEIAEQYEATKRELEEV